MPAHYFNIMASKRNKPNYSMYLPPDLREEIDELVKQDYSSSVAAFLIVSARTQIECIKSEQS